MKKHITIMALSVLFLSACSNMENFDNVRSAREPVVTKAENHFDVSFEYGASHLSQIERNQIEKFIMQYDVSRKDDLIVYISQQGGDISKLRAETVTAYLRHLGLKPQLAWQDSQTELQKIRVTLGRYMVSVPDCPDWSDRPVGNYNNQVHSNFGCADASNLALMIGNPQDLIQGRESTPVDGDYLSNALTDYQLPKSSAQASDEASQ